MPSRLAAAAGVAAVAILAAGAAFLVVGDPSGPPKGLGRAEVEEANSAPPLPPRMTFEPIFEPCAHCHEIGPGAHTMTGPVLNGVVGRKAGTRTDYPYSEAMKKAGIVWTEANLKRFLASPESVVPGTRMRFGGLPEDEIGPLIAFLKTAPGK
jgi:cytochrome c